MPNMRRATTAALCIGLTIAFSTVNAGAAAFAAWKVAGLPFGDVLNVRKYPASTSQLQAGYPAGTVLQMTGKCTGGVDLFDIAGLSDAKQRQIVRYRWCQVWHDPARDGKFVTGWVYGRYIAPL